ncbi:MAG TPA: oxidoreductase [Caldisericia bacterium]|nr:oxidoreductase [Caldisericia bacterium]HPF48745.1 oxidoreductase [Caldisericia bacterium]HPI83595.1 oxidoreductase [Caldisericia bacterium]HPQ93200.1 oxidoreductase [Caldisericia bacterium]HRV74967.1 oxidoreductase [Caldisericia bacterium]
MRPRWTQENIPNQDKKTIIVTGGNTGLGFESVKMMSGKGATVVLACRNTDKGEVARERIANENPAVRIEVMKLDLADLRSIRDFATNFTDRFDRLDVLLNNAGVMMCPYGKTTDGFETQLGTNHLGHFALTGLLFGILKSTKNSRVVNISSIAHRFGRMNFGNLMFEDGGYTPMKAYGRSKLANLLFTYELCRRLGDNASGTKAVVAHPGLSNTELDRHILKNRVLRFIRPVFGLASQSAAMGALAGIRACVDPNASNGDYYGPRGIGGTKGYPKKVSSNRRSHNESDSKKLWEMSEDLTGVSFPY